MTPNIKEHPIKQPLADLFASYEEDVSTWMILDDCLNWDVLWVRYTMNPDIYWKHDIPRKSSSNPRSIIIDIALSTYELLSYS